MDELLREMIAWLGFLSRGPVLTQLLAVPALWLLPGALARWGWLRGPLRRRPWQRGLALLAMASLALALHAGGQPSALLAILAGLLAGWQALALVPQLLAPHVEAHAVQVLTTRLLRPLFLVVALLLLVRLLDNPAVLGLIPLGTWVGSAMTLGSLLGALLLLYVLIMGMEPPTAAVAWLAQRFLGISDGSRRAMAVILHYAVVGLGLLWILDRLGVNRTALVAVAGGLSVGVGFGIKEVVSNFISGLWLLIEGSVRPGDVLIVDGEACQVRRLGPRAAILWRDRDNAELLIPNQTFFTNATVTYTHTDSLRRCQVTVGAAFRHPPAKVISLLERTAASVEGVLPAPPARAFLLSYGDSAIQYAVRFWIASALDNTSTSSAVQQAIWQSFGDNGIEIPYPHQVEISQRGQEPPGSAPGR
ncbi:MAG: mechanosensitive ion channel [Cyanobacteria bacterium K_Offshore_surface_m2_239]|nr:mechanosensitive ion channel [Cyanobacteria bacterium K_Offshore_surface_m2_239]